MAGPDARPARLLVMDDDKDLCELLALRLASTVEVLCAHDGESGILIAQASSPHLFLIDVFMPRLSGLSVVRFLKHQARFHGAPVILMTAYQKNLAQPEVLSQLADAVLQKPFDVRMLQTLIAPLLPRDRGAAPVSEAAPAAGAPFDPSKQRRAPRVALELPASLSSGGERLEGAIRSLSPFGALFESAASVPDEGEISFQLDDVAMSFRTRVLYRSQHQGRWLTGIRMQAVTLDGEFRLWRHVESLHASAQGEKLTLALVERFKGRGLSVLRATAGGFPEPRRVRRYAPNVLAYDEERERIHFGVSLPGFVLTEPRSRGVLEELANEQMADGASRGQPMPLSLAVPAGWMNVARRVATGLELSGAARASLEIFEVA